MIRRIVVIVLGVLCAAAVLVCTFVAGRYSVVIWRVKTSSIDNDVERDYLEGFESTVNAWNSYVTENDGYIPGDAARALIESGKVESYRKLSHIVFAADLPPRVNPLLSENAKFTAFFWIRPEILEVWTCYTDGTWQRVPYDRSSSDSAMHEYRPRSSGFPEWKSLKERDMWILEHKDSIHWDATRHLYTHEGGT